MAAGGGNGGGGAGSVGAATGVGGPAGIASAKGSSASQRKASASAGRAKAASAQKPGSRTANQDLFSIQKMLTGKVPSGATLGEQRAALTPQQVQAIQGQVQEGMQMSEAGVPFYNFTDPGQDPGYLRPPTQQDVAYGERLDRAQAIKAEGKRQLGYDPVLSEQRITAAERQNPARWRGEKGDAMRAEAIYGKSKLSNVGDMMTNAYQNTLGMMVPFAYLPGGAIRDGNPNSSFGKNVAEGWPEQRILWGEGTPGDQDKAYQRRLDLYTHDYYGQPDPGPRARNVYDELAMPQPKPTTPMIDYGQNDIPLYLRSAGKGIDNAYGPYTNPPPGAETGLPAGALQSHGVASRPYFTNEQKAMIQQHSGDVEKLSPQLQDYVKRLSSEPEVARMIDFSGGKKQQREEGEEEKKGGKGLFNILEILLSLIGLPLKLLGLTPPGEKKSGGQEKKRFSYPQQQDKANRSATTRQYRMAGQSSPSGPRAGGVSSGASPGAQ